MEEDDGEEVHEFEEDYSEFIAELFNESDDENEFEGFDDDDE